MKYESPNTCHSKDMTNVKVFENGSNFKARTSNIMVLIERSCHKEYTYEIPITYHSKDMAYIGCKPAA
jgi:hypothetical protein